MELIQHSEKGLVSLSGLGFVPRTCLKLGQQRSRELATQGAIPPLSNVQLPVWGTAPDEFAKFTKCLIDGTMRDKKSFVDAGVSGDDIDWVSRTQEFLTLLQQGMLILFGFIFLLV